MEVVSGIRPGPEESSPRSGIGQTEGHVAGWKLSCAEQVEIGIVELVEPDVVIGQSTIIGGESESQTA